MLIQMLNSMHARHIISRFFSVSFRSDQLIASSFLIDWQSTRSRWLVRKCVKFIANATVVKTYRNLKWSRRRRRRWRKRRRWRRWRKRREDFCMFMWLESSLFLNRNERIIKTRNMRRYRVISYDKRTFSSANFWTCMQCSLIFSTQKKRWKRFSNSDSKLKIFDVDVIETINVHDVIFACFESILYVRSEKRQCFDAKSDLKNIAMKNDENDETSEQLIANFFKIWYVVLNVKNRKFELFDK